MFRFMVVVSLIVGVLSGIPHLRRPRTDGRIIGGEPVDITSYPYQVSMEIGGSFHCGGSIIDMNWVLTASHCVEGASPIFINFRAGSSILGSGGSLHPAVEIYMHPNFDADTYDFDVAVVKVSVPFQYSNTVQPISLTLEKPSTGTSVVVSGWGDRDNINEDPLQLHAVNINISDFKECNDIYEPLYGGITERMICAGVPQGGKGVCYGDSGGALVADGRVVGIVSWGHNCASNNYPQVYADVASLKSWVTSVTGVN